MVSIEELEKTCMVKWERSYRNFAQLVKPDIPRIQDFFDFKTASSQLKIHVAEKIMHESTSHVGSFGGNGDPQWFFANFASDIQRRGIFDDRHSEPMRAAILLLARDDLLKILSVSATKKGGAALAAMYLLAQLEYVFRVKSDYLDEEGYVIRLIPPDLLTRTELPKGTKVGDRVSAIDKAFLLYLNSGSDPLRDRLLDLNDDVEIKYRLKRIRHDAMHGASGDVVFSEGYFYGLLTAMFYYSEPGG